MNYQQLLQYQEITDSLDNNFFKIDSIDSKFSINRKGLIFNNVSKTHVNAFLIDDVPYIRLSSNGEFYSLPLSKVLLMAFSSMHTNLDNYRYKLKVSFLNENRDDYRLENLFWIIPEGGIACKYNPDLYSVPGNPKVLVDKKFNIYKIKTMEKIPLRVIEDNNIYPRLSIENNSFHTFKFNLPFETIIIHRLICLAFKPMLITKEKFLVNHIDGNKTNFNVDNLEWVTHTGNRVHAVETGLCVQSKRIYSYNIKTDERQIFASTNDAGRVFNIHPWTVGRSVDRLVNHNEAICMPYLFTHSKEDLEKAIKRINNLKQTGYKYFKVVNNKTNKVDYIRGIRNLEKYLGTKQVNINSVEPTVIRGYSIYSVTEYDLPEDVLNGFRSAWSNHGGKKQKSIEVTNLRDKSVTTYETFDEFANLVGAKRKTIQRRILYNNGIWNNYKIKYLE